MRRIAVSEQPRTLEVSEKTGLGMAEIGQKMDEGALDGDSSDLFD